MREAALHTVKEWRERQEISLQQAKTEVEISQLLEQLERADTLDEVKSVLSIFITHVTGVR